MSQRALILPFIISRSRITEYQLMMIGDTDCGRTNVKLVSRGLQLPQLYRGGGAARYKNELETLHFPPAQPSLRREVINMSSAARNFLSERDVGYSGVQSYPFDLKWLSKYRLLEITVCVRPHIVRCLFDYTLHWKNKSTHPVLPSSIHFSVTTARWRDP